MTDLSALGTVAGQIASAVTSSATPVTAVANAVSDVAKDVALIANPTLTQRINQLKEAAQTDVTHVKNLLLAGNLPGVQSAFAGLPGYIGIELSPAEYQQFGAIRSPLDGNQLLGAYAAGRAAKLESDIAELVEVAGAKS